MASLTEVYEGGAGGANLRRLYLGVGLFLVGAILSIGGILVGTSAEVAAWLGYSVFETRSLAGLLAGVGLPVTFLGIVTVLPQAGRRVRAAAVAGAIVALFGVVGFVEVYPHQWYRDPIDYTLPVVTLYALGALTSFWSVFTAVANFKTRNDPGGTVKLEVTKEGKTRVVEVSNDRLRRHLGGIGLLGATPDGEAETQTARPEYRTKRRTGSARSSAPAVSDGGSTGTQLRTPGTTSASASGGDAEVLDGPSPAPKQDTYCGNCAHFRYVRTDDGIQPYCGAHDEVMDDMEPCSQWLANNQ